MLVGLRQRIGDDAVIRAGRSALGHPDRELVHGRPLPEHVDVGEVLENVAQRGRYHSKGKQPEEGPQGDDGNDYAVNRYIFGYVVAQAEYGSRQADHAVERGVQRELDKKFEG